MALLDSAVSFVKGSILGIDSSEPSDVEPFKHVAQYRWRIAVVGDLSLQLPSSLVLSADVNIPGFEVDAFSRGQVPVHFVGGQSAGTCTITYYCEEEMYILRKLMYWRGLIRNDDGTYNYESKYKRTIECTLLTSKNKPVVTVTLKKAWPSGSLALGLDYTSSDFITLPQEFSFDSYDVKFKK